MPAVRQMRLDPGDAEGERAERTARRLGDAVRDEVVAGRRRRGGRAGCRRSAKDQGAAGAEMVTAPQVLLAVGMSKVRLPTPHSFVLFATQVMAGPRVSTRAMV